MMPTDEGNIADPKANPAKGSSQRRLVRRVVRSKPAEQDTQQIPPPPDDNANAPEPERPSIFRCLKCATQIPNGSDTCPKCGTKYLKDGIPKEAEEAEIDAELALEDDFEDLSPLFEQDDLGCGYFDVDHGIVAYIEPRRGSKDAIFECLNCRTILEFEADRCPFCHEQLKKIEDGIVEIATGVIVGDDLDMEVSKDVFCPICGDLLALEGGRCIVCDTQLVVPENEGSSMLSPVVPSNNLIFLHLSVPNGAINYLSSAETPAPKNSPEISVDDSFEDFMGWIDDPDKS
jgi:RNA polymerase subunit RPABC4/transcription elongation factor Spt4